MDMMQTKLRLLISISPFWALLIKPLQKEQQFHFIEHLSSVSNVR